MKDKTFKKTIIIIILISLITLVINSLITINLLHQYNTNENIIISHIINNVKEEYPNISEEEIIKSLNDKDLSKDNIMTDYGIELEDNAISIANQNITRKLIISNLLTLLIFILITILIVKLYQYHKARNINQLLNYLKEINNKNYTL